MLIFGLTTVDWVWDDSSHRQVEPVADVTGSPESQTERSEGQIHWEWAEGCQCWESCPGSWEIGPQNRGGQ